MEDSQHLIKSLQDKYTITKDFVGKKICGLDLKWDYINGWVDVSMDNFVKKTLKKLNFNPDNRKQYAPHKWMVPIFGYNRQFAPSDDTSTPLDKKGIKRVQQVVGSFLYYVRAIDNTIITALNEITLKQSKPTENTNEKIKMLLNY